MYRELYRVCFLTTLFFSYIESMKSDIDLFRNTSRETLHTNLSRLSCLFLEFSVNLKQETFCKMYHEIFQT